MEQGEGAASKVEFESDARVRRSLVGLMKARDVHLEESAVGLVAAQGNVSVLNGGCGPVLGNGGVTIRNGGCGAPDRERGRVDRERRDSGRAGGRRRNDRPQSSGRPHRLAEGHRRGGREGVAGLATGAGVRRRRRRRLRAAVPPLPPLGNGPSAVAGRPFSTSRLTVWHSRGYLVSTRRWRVLTARRATRARGGIGKWRTSS